MFGVVTSTLGVTVGTRTGVAAFASVDTEAKNIKALASSLGMTLGGSGAGGGGGGGGGGEGDDEGGGGACSTS